MAGGALIYKQGDELPQWVATILTNGTGYDFSTGWSFQVVIVDADETVVLTKTTNITGATGGAITVAWAVGELDLDPGSYVAQLKARRTSDTGEATIRQPLRIDTRY